MFNFTKKYIPGKPNQDIPPFRLTVHIGAGKTGTTSIQGALLTNQEKLKSQGIHYLGMLLEHAQVRKYLWQTNRDWHGLRALQDKQRSSQLLDVLRGSIEVMKNRGITHAIWSNESFLKNASMFTDVLSELAGDGIDIRIVAYVRRHDVWMRSAYVQWGLKHKIYKGKIKSFDQWAVKGKADFARHLKSWVSIFSEHVIVRNFDSASDVVVDFMNVIGMSALGLKKFRNNETPSNEELLLRALFNAQHDDKVLPKEFNKVLHGNSLCFDHTVDEWLTQMLPDEDALKHIREDCEDDRASLDKLLKAGGQMPIDTSPLPEKPSRIHTGKLLMTLTQIVMKQAINLNAMQDKLNSYTADGLGATRSTESASNPEQTREEGLDVEKPVFVISTGRSGSTLIQRLLNCHKDLVIWGEHYGFLKSLANSYSQMSREKQYPKSDEVNTGPSQLLPSLLNSDEKIAWANPWSLADYKNQLKKFIEGYFAGRLEDGQRWGFKEIRYNKMPCLKMLRDLYPHGKFVFIKRNPIDVTRSKVFAFIKESKWDEFSNSQKTSNIRRILQDINDHYETYDQFMAENPGLGMIIHYDDLVNRSQETVSLTLSHLDLDPDHFDWVLAKQVMGVQLSVTKRDDAVTDLILQVSATMKENPTNC